MPMDKVSVSPDRPDPRTFDPLPVIQIANTTLYFVESKSKPCPWCEDMIYWYKYSVVEGSTDDKDHHVRLVPCEKLCIFAGR